MAFFYGVIDEETYRHIATINRLANFAGMYNAAFVAHDWKKAFDYFDRISDIINAARGVDKIIQIQYSGMTFREITAIRIWDKETDEVTTFAPRNPK